MFTARSPRIRLGFACLAFLAFARLSDASELASSPHVIVPLDSGWRFHVGDDEAAKSTEYNDSSWRMLDVPHDWSIEGERNPPPEGDADGGFFKHGIGWYRKSFVLTPEAAAKKIVVEFDGVYMNSDVWINGQFLGRRPYGFIGFRYDLTEYLKKDGTPNVLAVRVDDSAEPSTRWYNGSGIYRHVRLIETGFTHFHLDGGVRVSTPQVSAERAIIEVNVIIDAHFFTDEERLAWVKDAWHVKPQNREVVWRSVVVSPDGAEVANFETKLPLKSMLAGQRANQLIPLVRPQLWSDRTPTLYQLRSTLSLDGTTLDETTSTFGIRQVTFDNDRGLLVNGQPTKLKGVCVHQEAGSFGNAVPMAVWAWRLARLKEMGCNAIRPSHNPFAPEFYDLCDRLGFYVFDESFDEWGARDWTHNYTENPRGKAKYGYHLYFNQWSETDLRAMLRRDRNHPSIVLYSIGNEIPDQFEDEGWKTARRLVAICHEEDPTRWVTAACDQSTVSSRNGFMDALDLGGYNYIDRIYGEKTYAPERERFPHRLILGTETVNRLHNWLGVRDLDFVVGEFVWTGIDYLGEAHVFPRRGSSAGFLDLAGTRKSEFYRRSAYWRDDPVVQVSVLSGEKPLRPGFPNPARLHWNWPTGAQLTVQVLTNCDEVELFLNERSLGRHPVSHDAYASDWPVPYEPGVISAVAYRSGKKVAVNELRTAGPAARLVVAQVLMPIPSDISVYEITIVDSNGTVVPDATQTVTVHIEGKGQLLGLDTGDLLYGGLFKLDHRPAYQGRLLATVRRIAPDPEVRLVLETSGLPAASTQVLGRVP